jgi:hypothetical protein
MLSLEDQIARIADAAFAQTSPVEPPSPQSSDDPPRHGDTRRHSLVLAAAVVLGLVLIGGLVALVDDDRTEQAPPADSAVAPVASPQSQTTVAPTVATTPPTSEAPPGTEVPARGFAELGACSPQAVCTYSSLDDGRLVRLDSRFKNDALAAFTIYGDNEATTGFFAESFAPSSAVLVDVGPQDIAYIWWTIPGDESAHVSAYELTGPDAGRLVREFDARLDPSGDTELVATRDGFVELACCDVNPIRPAPDAVVMIPWVDRTGTEIAADDRTVFVVEINERLVVSADRPGDTEDNAWTVSFGDVAPRGMPHLYELDDGTVVMIADGADATSDPTYLRPDGTTETVDSPGSVAYVLPNGRFVVHGAEPSSFFLTQPLLQADSIVAPATPDSNPAINTLPRPLVAIDGNGDAVLLVTEVAEPQLLFDGQDPDGASQLGDGPNVVERISVAANQSIAYIGLCCAPPVGTILTTRPPEVAESTTTPTYGFAPTLNPSATLLAVAGPDSINVTDVTTGNSSNLETVDGESWDTTHDLMWLDDTTIAVLGNQTRFWTLTVITVNDLALDAGPTRVFARFEDFPQLQFAGTALDGEIAMHDVGTNRVLSGTIDDYGNNNGTRGTSLQVIELPGVALSAWYANPGHLVWTDTSRTLRVSGQVIPGEYFWARR